MKIFQKTLQSAALVSTVIALSGCGNSPPIHYHPRNSATSPQTSGSAKLLVEILPVALPERLNREEMVLTNGAGQLDVRDNDHWAAPLSDEVRQILSDTLWGQLGGADVYQAPVAPSATSLPQYRLAVRVERFEAVPGHTAMVQGSWTARRLPQGRAATCRANIVIPLPERTPEAAAAALSDGTGQLMRLVVDSIGRLNQDGMPACPTDGI